MHKRDFTHNKTRYAKFTKRELLSIFTEEAQHICKRPEEAYSIADSVLDDFIKSYAKYVKSV